MAILCQIENNLWRNRYQMESLEGKNTEIKKNYNNCNELRQEKNSECLHWKSFCNLKKNVKEK